MIYYLLVSLKAVKLGRLSTCIVVYYLKWRIGQLLNFISLLDDPTALFLPSKEKILSIYKQVSD